MTPLVAFDTETAKIEAGILAPDLACVSWCTQDFESGLWHQSDAEDRVEALLDRATLIGANVSFDTAVLARRYPRLLPRIFQAYFDGRILDVQLQQRLIDIAHGELDGYKDVNGVYHRFSYSLSALHERHGFGALDKSEDTWRLRYGELIDVPLSFWPEAASKYAVTDAEATMRVHLAQQHWAEYLKDSAAQARAGFALQLMSCRGMITDAKACDEYIAETKIEIEKARKLCLEAGLVREVGSKNTKAAKARMEAVCAELEIEPKRTAKEGICLDQEACRDTGDELLLAYSTYSTSTKILQRAEKFKLGSTGIPLQTAFMVLQDNGRTASRAPGAPLIGDNLQNLPRKGKLRNCFVPRPGFYYVSVDYNGLELHTFAQCEIWLTGNSLMAEAINAGQDLHCRMAATILGCSYDEALTNKKVGKYKEARQLAKIANFGFLGGCGPKTFTAQTNAKAENASERITVAQAYELKQAWLRTWQPQAYFEWVNSQLGDGSRLCTFKQFISERVRGHLGYTELANTPFSGLANDLTKSTLLPISFECYADRDSALFGSHPVMLVHDEVVAEVPIETSHEASYRMRDIMVERGSLYVPDVKPKAEPALMRWWSKTADTKLVDGRLVPCE